MPTTSFNDFFAGVRMTALAAAAQAKMAAPRVLPDSFYTPGPTKPYNDQVQFPSVTWSRTGALVIGRNSPPRAVNLGSTVYKFATIFNMKEEMDLDIQFLEALFSNNNMVSEGSLRELNTRMIQFNRRTDMTRNNMVHSLFANGKVWIGTDGQVLASSSGAQITFDPGVPTGNLITKDGAGGTFNIGDWSSATTDIGSRLRVLQETMTRAGSPIPTTILYGTSIPSYLSTNNTIKNFYGNNMALTDNQRTAIAATGAIPNGFLGFNWQPVRLSFLEKADASVAATFATNYIGLVPEPDDSWYEPIEGGTLTPAGVAGDVQVQPGSSFQSMLNNIRVAYGKYAYGVAKTHPVVQFSMVQGDCFGPVLKNPNALSFGTVS
jgi:hypothetical protein